MPPVYQSDTTYCHFLNKNLDFQINLEVWQLFSTWLFNIGKIFHLIKMALLYNSPSKLYSIGHKPVFPWGSQKKFGTKLVIIPVYILTSPCVWFHIVILILLVPMYSKMSDIWHNLYFILKNVNSEVLIQLK